MQTRLFITIFMIFGLFTSKAQKLLTVEEATDKALKSNFNIQVARNEMQVLKINNTLGRAGMLPDISAKASGSYEINSGKQELASGDEVTFNGSTSSVVNAGIELSWTLFDGGRMFIAKSQLNQLQAAGELKYKLQVQQLTFNVISAYYQVVMLKQQLKALETISEYNNERVKITQKAFETGTQPKTNWLQARIDLNVTQQTLINQRISIEQAKKELNSIMGSTADEQFDVNDSIEIKYIPNKDELFKRIDSANMSIQFYKRQIDIARLDLKSNKRLYSPQLQFNAGYYTGKNINSDGAVLKNQSSGPQVGGSLVIPIFRAGETKRKIELSELEIASAENNLGQAQLEANTDLIVALMQFENQQQLYTLEVENNILAKENLDICIERLRLGQTNSLEVHLAEQTYMQSATRLIQFRYALKISEIRLKQLVAEL